MCEPAGPTQDRASGKQQHLEEGKATGTNHQKHLPSCTHSTSTTHIFTLLIPYPFPLTQANVIQKGQSLVRKKVDLGRKVLTASGE
jgi:hypothetical protein